VTSCSSETLVYIKKMMFFLWNNIVSVVIEFKKILGLLKHVGDNFCGVKIR